MAFRLSCDTLILISLFYLYLCIRLQTASQVVRGAPDLSQCTGYQQQRFSGIPGARLCVEYLAGSGTQDVSMVGSLETPMKGGWFGQVKTPKGLSTVYRPRINMYGT